MNTCNVVNTNTLGMDSMNNAELKYYLALEFAESMTYPNMIWHTLIPFSEQRGREEWKER